MAEMMYRDNGKSRTIVIVKSCQKFKDRQDACRATWAGELSRRGIPLWFLEAGHEQTKIQDCWLLMNGGDSYDDNSFKVRDALKFFLQYDPFDQVFICDDNTFVQWRRWLQFLQSDHPFCGLKTKKIPWVHGGGGWFMGRTACEAYIEGVKKRCSWDDRLVSEILDPLGFPFENRPELFAQWQARVAADNQLITCHNVDPAEMLTLFRDTYEL